MALESLDTLAVARALALVASHADDLADVYFERRLEVELPDAEATTGLRVRREEGLAARLVRGGRSWLASRDGLSAADLSEALRAVARALPPALPLPLTISADAEELAPPVEALLDFPGRLERALRRQLVGFPLRLSVRWHERASRVVGPHTASPVEREAFASVEVVLPWDRLGALTLALGDEEAERLAERLAVRFRARGAASPPPGRPRLLLAPAAAAVALHEGVAHALEADLLARSGSPVAAEGVQLCRAALDVFDDPGSAPTGVRRTVDDEGVATVRRWLLRGGRAAQPIADLRSARRWPELLPGSGFRADRHAAPLPRTHHLELLAGTQSLERLLAAAEGGLLVTEIASGALDPRSGEVVLEAPGARRVRGGAAAEAVGRFTIRGQVTELLDGLVAVGELREGASAGWCAKERQRRAVWATVPALVVEGLEVAP